MKKRAVCSYENMNEELAAAFAAKYPKGYSDFLPDLKEYPKPDGTSFYAVTVELPESIYLVKIKVKVDDVEDLERWLDSDEGDDSISGGEGESGDALPDDNISQYTNGEEDSNDSE
ncbi:MAG: hypothetical protein HUJ94_08110 [Bacteroidales bacterium]|nr:hypothetical protein [Bacteroidales bacterium]